MSFLKIRRKGERTKQSLAAASENIAPLPSSVLGVSDTAAQRIINLLDEKDNHQLYLRVAIKGGGCSGLSIHYEFCESLRDDDSIFENSKARVCIDKKSLSVLGGATLHFREHLGSGEFVLVNNPAAKQCSCGQSFAL